MTTVLVGMLVCLGLALVVLALVAVPRVREGERILTTDGEVALRDARRRARALAAEARQRAEEVRERAAELAAEARERAERARPEPRPGQGPGQGTEQGPWTPADGLRPATPATPAPATRAGTPGAALPTPPPPADNDDVIDLREQASRTTQVRDRIARRLEWGEPEPGPRHRR